MYARSAPTGDRERARPLLDAALAQFTAIDMPGWIRRAEHLRDTGREYVPTSDGAASTPRTAPASSGPVELRREGQFWTLACGGGSIRLKDSRGLRLLAHLLQNSGQEFHVL